MSKIKSLNCLKWTMVILFIITTVMSPMVSTAGLKFGIISVVKDKIEELKEKRIEKEKTKVHEGTTGADGTVTFHDEVAGRDIQIKAYNKSNEDPVSGINIKYANTGNSIICEATDPSNSYFPHLVIKHSSEYNARTTKQSEQSEEYKIQIAPLAVIAVGLAIYSGVKAVIAYATESEDLPDIDLIRKDPMMVKVTIEGDFNDIWNLISITGAIIPLISIPASISVSSKKAIVKIARWVAMAVAKEASDEFFDTTKNYRMSYYMLDYTNIYMGGLHFEEVINQLTSGSVTLEDEQGFDFSAEKVFQVGSQWSDYPEIVSKIDLGLSDGWICASPAISGTDTLGNEIKDMGAVELSEVVEAPATGYITDWIEPIAGHVYCLITQDNKYAKVKFTSVDPDNVIVTFDWVYQPDGSRFF